MRHERHEPRARVVGRRAVGDGDELVVVIVCVEEVVEPLLRDVPADEEREEPVAREAEPVADQPRRSGTGDAAGTPTGKAAAGTFHVDVTQSATAGLTVVTADASRAQRPRVAMATCWAASSTTLCWGTKATCCVRTLGVRRRFAAASTATDEP